MLSLLFLNQENIKQKYDALSADDTTASYGSNRSIKAEI